MSLRSRLLMLTMSARRSARTGCATTRWRRRRLGRRGWRWWRFGRRPGLPGRLDPELLFVAGLRHGSGELHPGEGRRVLEQGNELVGGAGLAGDLEALLVHAQ